MKKISIIKAFFLTLTALGFVSCHDVIFDTIRDEVKLEDAQVQGDINAIVRYTLNGTERLFTQNGNIYYKDVSQNPTTTTDHGNWVKASKSGMGQVVKLAADSTYLYALSATITEDTDEGENYVSGATIFYTTDAETWTAVEIGGETSFTNVIALFCTNAPQSDSRKAYARIGTDAVYELNGSSATALTIGETDYTTSPTSGTRSAAYFNGNTYFSSGHAMATNETADTPATYLYYATTDNIFYSADGSTWDSVDLTMGTILSISVTSDYLILGTSGGYKHAKFSTETPGIPTTDTSNLPVNAESALSSAYYVYTVLAVDPSLSETEGDIYATATYSGSSSSSSATRSKEALWAYYPGTNEWNRD